MLFIFANENKNDVNTLHVLQLNSSETFPMRFVLVDFPPRMHKCVFLPYAFFYRLTKPVLKTVFFLQFKERM